MKTLFIFIFRLVLLVTVAVWLATHPGTAHIVWHGYIIETSASVLCLIVIAAGLVIYAIFRLGHFLKHGPAYWRLNRRLKNMREGQQHLMQGLVAIASGHAVEAGRQAVQARKKLGANLATQLLQAQAAQLAGDYVTAQEIFRAIASDTDSAPVGYRGLIMEARRREDWPEVERLAEKLHRLKPETPWLNLIRFDLLTRHKDWDHARIALNNISAANLADKNYINQSYAALLVASSIKEAAHGRQGTALQYAEQAFQQNSDWLPAIINLARQQIASGHKRAANRTITKNWATHAHPQLAALYRQSTNDFLDAYKQITKLCQGREDLGINRLILAEAALAADIWGEARRELIHIISRGRATQSAYKLMARLERRENGNETAASQWLIKAADAAPDPIWLCHLCGGSHLEWQATCSHCGQFNTLNWQTPGISHKPQDASFMLLSNWIE